MNAEKLKQLQAQVRIGGKVCLFINHKLIYMYSEFIWTAYDEAIIINDAIVIVNKAQQIW